MGILYAMYRMSIDLIYLYIFVIFLSSVPFILLYLINVISKKINMSAKFLCISFVSCFLGGLLGFLFGLSSSPVVETIASGVFGLIGAFAIYFFGKNWSTGKYVGLSMFSFGASFFLLILYGFEYSLPGKEYDFCLEVFSDSDFSNDMVQRMKEHCGNYFPEFFKK